MKKVKDIIVSGLKDPIARNSAVMFIGNMTGSFMNYIYNLFMGRMLGPEKYGVLAALMSLLYIVNIPSSAITTTIVKYTSNYKGENKIGKVRFIFEKLSNAFLLVGIVIFAFFLLFRFPVAQFLKIKEPILIVLMATLFIASLPMTINTGIISGLQKFNFIAGNSIFAAFIKLSLAFTLVKVGLGVRGALIGLSLSFFLPYFLTFLPLRKLKEVALENALPWKEMAKYALPAFLASLGMGLFTNTDIVLVKRFFSPYEAGIYSALSLTSRTIYFASTSVVTVMFALVAERFAKKADYKKVFLTSFGLVALGVLACTIFYAIFPNFVMRFFFGSKYLEAAKYLGLFALFISIYSLCFLMINYFLSIHQTKIALLSLSAAFLQAILIYFFHKDFWEVVWASVISTSILITVLGTYYLRAKEPVKS